MLGKLHEDLQAVAMKILPLLGNGECTVWAEDDGKVYAGNPVNLHELPQHWIAGTYSLGQPLHDIGDDLRALMHERARDWLID